MNVHALSMACRRPAWVLALGIVAAAGAHASTQMAMDYGCYNCHAGTGPRKNAPSLAELARRYAPLRDDAKAQQRLVDKLRQGEPFGRVYAHERLSPETAAALVRWLCDGAP